MKNLITSNNLTFTKKNCNCGITSDALDIQSKLRKKSYKTKSKRKNRNKSKKNKKE